MFLFLLASCLPLPAATVIDSAKLGQDTTLVHTGAAAIAPIVPTQWQWLITPLCSLIIGLLIWLSHVKQKEHTTATIAAATGTATKVVVLLALIMLTGLSACKSTQYSVTPIPNGFTATESVGTKGANFTEGAVLHKGSAQRDSCWVFFSIPDSVSNNLINDIYNDLQLKLPK